MFKKSSPPNSSKAGWAVAIHRCQPAFRALKRKSSQSLCTYTSFSRSLVLSPPRKSWAGRVESFPLVFFETSKKKKDPKGRWKPWHVLSFPITSAPVPVVSVQICRIHVVILSTFQCQTPVMVDNQAVCLIIRFREG